MSTLRVLLVDDHTLVRTGLRLLLEQVPGVAVVGEVADGRQALAAVVKARPDIVLMDVGMPGMGGLEATRRLHQQHPNVRVIMLSIHANEEYVLQALDAGASGYLLKDASTKELESALLHAGRGEQYLSPAVSRPVLDAYVRRVREQAGPYRSLLEELTPRQREILQLIAEGHTTHNIARQLDISVKTVEAHRSQLMRRLGIFDIAGLVRYAIRAGLVSAER